MIGFAICHGWAFDAQALAPLVETLTQIFPEATSELFDLGFTGAPQSPSLATDREWIAVGHSYGFAYLMQQPVSWKAAISVNGFTRFCRSPSQQEGAPVRLVDAMLQRLATKPQATVQEFYALCGARHTVSDKLDTFRLCEHLTRLRDLDFGLPPLPILALATQDDAIVPLALAQACFAQSECGVQQWPGDHLRLLCEPALCSDTITRFVEQIDA